MEPVSKEVQVFHNISIKAGTKAVFSCRAPDSNPKAEITWFKNGFKIEPDQAQMNQTTTINNPNDFSTISYISFDVESADHTKELRCDIRVGSISRVMHGSLTMDVKFAPEILVMPSSVVSVNEDKEFKINLTARANPAPTYSCTAANKKTYNVTTNNTIEFKATRDDNTDFTCLLKNDEGTTEIKFRLDVKYAPTAKAEKSVYVSTVGETTQLTCLVEGNPIETKHITWKLNNKYLTNSNEEQHYSVKFVPPNKSILTVHNVQASDDGNFTCHINNKVGKAADASTELHVKRVPEILMDKSVLKAGEDGNIGRSARFECWARGYPDVKFKWKQPSNEAIAKSKKYEIEEKTADGQIYISVLTVKDVASSDYGSYLCEARSEIGAIAEKAVLSGKHQPEQPSDFRVVNITRNSITLQWTKNFDGGDSQRFRVRYRKDTMDPTYRYIETESAVSSLLLDNLETATRYVINIQSLNKFGTDGFLRDPLVVQTDFGFDEVNQLPIYNENNLPLTIILVVCGVGTLLLLFNVALIVYLIKRKKKKGEADSTTDTNETDANIVEMFSPPPPYPDELNYQFGLNGDNFEVSFSEPISTNHFNNKLI